MPSKNSISILMILAMLLLSGCVGKHNIPAGPTMDLVAIEYDAAWLVGDKFSLHKAAEDGFREVLELAPQFAEAHYNLAVALAHQARWHEALVEFNHALEAKKNFELAVIGRDLALRMLNADRQSTDIPIPRYCRTFHELYELGC